MTTERDPRTRIVLSWLREETHENAERVLLRVLNEVDTTPQRRSWWPAWRTNSMNKLVAYGLGAAAVVVALAIGTQVLGPSAPGNVGGVPSASPSPTAAATATPQPSPSRRAAPPLTQSFTSDVHGISLSYPEGWTARAATEPWMDRPGVPQSVDPGFDVLQDPVLTDHLFLYFASQPIGATTPEEWVAEKVADDDCSATEPISVDGVTGLINDCDRVAVTTAGRGYWIQVFRSNDDPSAVASYDRAWLEEVLATVQLQPEDAVDVAPSATP